MRYPSSACAKFVGAPAVQLIPNEHTGGTAECWEVVTQYLFSCMFIKLLLTACIYATGSWGGLGVGTVCSKARVHMHLMVLSLGMRYMP